MSISRLRALVVMSVLAVAAITMIIWTITRDSQEGASNNANCAVSAKKAAAIPAPQHIKVRVLNATDRPNLASSIKDQLVQRGFNVVGVDNSDTSIEGVAEVHFGPKVSGAAQLVQAQVPHAQSLPDDITSDVVELILGPKFESLTPTNQVAKTLKHLGKPALASTGCVEQAVTS